MSFDTETLFRLLPAIHRIRDAEVAGGLGGLLSAAEQAELATLEGLASPTVDQQLRIAALRDAAASGPLHALMAAFAGEFATMEESLEQLYDDLFVETCAPWAVPYIGDLIGYRLLHGRAPGLDRRPEVAHTIAFRRRKGTLAMLEQLALDVTGWKSRAVEFFQLLATTQYMNHVRGHNLVTPDLRDGLALERIGSAFDPVPRTLDVRRISRGRGRYNVPNIGIFLWRLDAQRRGPSPPAPHPGDATGRRFRFSPLGNDVPLHTRPVPEQSITSLAGPLNVPAPITRRALRMGRADYYGEDASIAVWFDGTLFPLANIRSCNLSDVPGTSGADWAHDAPPGTIAVDPVLGRLVVADDVPFPASLKVTFHEAAPADFAGGPYARSATFASPPGAVRHVPGDFATIAAALAALGGEGVVEVADNGCYREAISIDVTAGRQIELRAADGARPLLELTAPMELRGGADSEVVLNGLLISGGALEVPPAGHALKRVTIRHATLVPGRTLNAAGEPGQPGAPSVIVRRGDTELTIERSIVGPVRVVTEASAGMLDSIVDSCDAANVAFAAPDVDAPGGNVTFESCTVIGQVLTLVLEASSSILLSPATAVRRQQGCVRFSYLPLESVAPRRFRCQPETGPGEGNAPGFTTLRYGVPGYARLTRRTPPTLRRGGDGDTEMGAFRYLYEPQRESDLLTRLDEYLRVGLEAGIFYES